MIAHKHELKATNMKYFSQKRNKEINKIFGSNKFTVFIEMMGCLIKTEALSLDDEIHSGEKNTEFKQVIV